MDEVELLQEQVRVLEKQLNMLVASDRYTFQKTLQIFDGRNFQFGLSTGTKLGLSATEKIALHGATPVIQASAISAPSAPSAGYVQAEAVTMETAVNAIRTALANKGITT